MIGKYKGQIIECVYCGHKYPRPGPYAYCPKCHSDPDEPLCEYSQAAGWCEHCDDIAAQELCKETGLCPLA